MFFKQLRISAIMIVAMTILTGGVYPLAITAIAQFVFPNQAGGSLLERNGQIVGSELIGQSFQDPKFFWSRPSATGPVAYNAAVSSGSNQGPLNENLHTAIAARVAALRQADPDNTAPVPVDLITASGSGLDPHISLAAARYQAGRVARVRGLPEETVRALVERNTEGRLFGILGESRVNVLKMNLELEKISK